jgi:ABC-three component (ABC-3C) system Middle Component 6
MILPSKHLPQERALLTVGANLLAVLERPMTVSALWQSVLQEDHAGLSFDWFVLALDLLYLLGAVQLRDGLLTRAHTGQPA